MPANLDNYVEVADRIIAFHEKYPEGSLRCKEIREVTIGGSDYLIYVAQAWRHPTDEAPAEGAAWEPVPGKTNFTRDSELQNCETSAWGRAIAALGFEVKKGIASREEVTNREQATEFAAARDKTAKALKPHNLTAADQRDLVHAVAGDPPTIDGLQRVIDIIEAEGLDALYAAAELPKPEIVARREEIQAAYDEAIAKGNGAKKDLSKGRFAAELKGATTPELLDKLEAKVKALA
jgi:hypothetical protein